MIHSFNRHLKEAGHPNRLRVTLKRLRSNFLSFLCHLQHGYFFLLKKEEKGNFRQCMLFIIWTDGPCDHRVKTVFKARSFPNPSPETGFPTCGENSSATCLVIQPLRSLKPAPSSLCLARKHRKISTSFQPQERWDEGGGAP